MAQEGAPIRKRNRPMPYPERDFNARADKRMDSEPHRPINRVDDLVDLELSDYYGAGIAQPKGKGGEDPIALLDSAFSLTNFFPTSFMYIAQAGTGVAPTAGRWHLLRCLVPRPKYLAALLQAIAGTSAGSIRMCVYEEGDPTNQLPDGGRLLAQTGSIASPGTWRLARGTVTRAILQRGFVWYGVSASDNSIRLVHVSIRPDGQGRYFDQAYGAAPDPCPATTSFTSDYTAGGMGYLEFESEGISP